MADPAVIVVFDVKGRVVCRGVYVGPWGLQGAAFVNAESVKMEVVEPGETFGFAIFAMLDGELIGTNRLSRSNRVEPGNHVMFARATLALHFDPSPTEVVEMQRYAPDMLGRRLPWGRRA